MSFNRWKNHVAASDYWSATGCSYEEHLLAKQVQLLEQQQHVPYQEQAGPFQARVGAKVGPGTAIAYMLGFAFAFFLALMAAENIQMAVVYMILPPFWGIGFLVGACFDFVVRCFG